MIKNTLRFLFTLSIGLLILEIILRIINSDMKNYDIEMWRYSNELKTFHPKLGHIHKTDASSILQGVEISLNSYGMRSRQINTSAERKILFLGSSITLGWGVEQSKTVCGLLQNKFDEIDGSTEILNSSVGNYNTYRYVNLFFENLKHIQPQEIVVNFFLNDAEILEFGSTNWIIKNSQLAATLWITIKRLKSINNGSIFEHYNNLFNSDSKGFLKMKNSLNELAIYCRDNHIKAYFVLIPDFHYLENYPFNEIHNKIRKTVMPMGYHYLDLLNSFKGVPFSELEIMPGDSHPNKNGHKKYFEEIFKLLNTN